MNRWNPIAHLRFFPCALVLSLAAAMVPAAAQNLRPFPPGAQRGALVVVEPPDITVNDKPERLSPGARIHGADNLVMLSAALVGQSLLVNFVREPHGLVHEVWILTPAEAANPLP